MQFTISLAFMCKLNIKFMLLSSRNVAYKESYNNFGNHENACNFSVKNICENSSK